MVNEKIHNASGMDNDTLHLIDDDLNEIITYLIKELKRSKKRLKTLSVYQTNCHKTLGGILFTREYKGTLDKDKTIPKTKNMDKSIPKTKPKT